MADISSWLPNLLGPLDLQVEGAPAGIPRRSTVNLHNLTATDDPTTQITTIAATGGTGAGGQSSQTLVNGANHNVALSSKAVLRISGPTQPFSVTGLAWGASPPSDGQPAFLYNTGSEPMTLKHDNTGSAAGNRILCPDGRDITVPAGALGAILVWDVTSAHWIAISTQRSMLFHAPDFGCKGDGVTNDSVGVSACLSAAAAVGGIAYFPATGSSYYCTSAIALPSGVTIRGDTLVANQSGGSSFKFDTPGAGFVINDSTFNVEIDHVQIITTSTAGAALTIPAGVLGSGFLRFPYLVVVHGNPNIPAIQFGTDGAGNGVQIDPVFFGVLQLTSPAAMSVPMIAWYGKGGGFGGVTIEKLWIQGGGFGADKSTAPFVLMKDTDDGAMTNICIEHYLAEIPYAGALHLYSVTDSKFSDITAIDLVGDPTDHLIKVDKSPLSSVASTQIEFDTIFTSIGKTGANSIFINGFVCNNITVRNSLLQWVGNDGPGAGPLRCDGCVVNGFDGDQPTGWIRNDVHSSRVYSVLPNNNITPALGVNVDFAASQSPFGFLYLQTGSLTGAFTIDSITAGVDGQRLSIYNPSSWPMTLRDEGNATTTHAANKIATMRHADVKVWGPGIVDLIYSATASRWILLHTNPTDNPIAFYPNVIPGTFAIYDAQKNFTFNSGASVTNLKDLVGGRDISQAILAQMPTQIYPDPTVNHDASLNFTTSSQMFLKAASFALPQPFTVIVVGNITAPSGSAQAFLEDNSGVTRFILQATATNGYLSCYAGGGVLASTHAVTSPTIMMVKADGDNTKLYANNSQTPLVTGGMGVPGTQGFTELEVGGITGDFLTGAVEYVQFINRAITDDEALQIFQSLGRRFAIEAS